jgi:hypothetical protein
MGTWGAGSFDNEDALDFVAELTGVKGWRAVRDVLGEPNAAPDELDGAYILAAADVVAALNEAPGAGLPEAVAAWVTMNRDESRGELIQQALAAVSVVAGEDSELRRLWESTDATEWLASVADLSARLQRAASAHLSPLE